MSYPIHYANVRSEEDMLQDGAVMTHWGACGACSTTKDLSVYLKYPDLTGKGQECGVRYLTNGFEEGVRCFQEVEYTRVSWVQQQLCVCRVTTKGMARNVYGSLTPLSSFLIFFCWYRSLLLFLLLLLFLEI